MVNQSKNRRSGSRSKRKKAGLMTRLKRQWRKFTKKARRWLIILFVFAIVCCGLYIFGNISFFPQSYSSAEYDGIDISKHQGKIDWKTVAEDKNIQFVYIKATEGASVVDKQYEKNLRQARAAGLKVGSYHFFRGYKPAKDQFAIFRKYVKKSEQDLIPMVDVEETGNRYVDRERLQKNLEEFMQLVKNEYGKYPLLYSQYHFYNQKLAPEFNKYYIFIARYGKQEPHLNGNGYYNIWQYTEKGRIKGIKGTVDLDKFANGTRLKDIML